METKRAKISYKLRNGQRRYCFVTTLATNTDTQIADWMLRQSQNVTEAHVVQRNRS